MNTFLNPEHEEPLYMWGEKKGENPETSILDHIEKILKGDLTQVSQKNIITLYSKVKNREKMDQIFENIENKEIIRLLITNVNPDVIVSFVDNDISVEDLTSFMNNFSDNSTCIYFFQEIRIHNFIKVLGIIGIKKLLEEKKELEHIGFFVNFLNECHLVDSSN